MVTYGIPGHDLTFDAHTGVYDGYSTKVTFRGEHPDRSGLDGKPLIVMSQEDFRKILSALDSHQNTNQDLALKLTQKAA